VMVVMVVLWFAMYCVVWCTVSWLCGVGGDM